MRWLAVPFLLCLSILPYDGSQLNGKQTQTKEPPLAEKMPVEFGLSIPNSRTTTPIPLITPTVPVRSESATIKLTNDVVLAFQSDKECVVTSSRLGYVEPNKRAGPAQIYAKFAEEPDVYQWKTFNKKWVHIIKPIQTGNCELLVWEVGITEEAYIQRFSIECNVGGQPSPPQPPDTIPAGDLRVLFIFESTSGLTREQINVKNSTSIRKYCNDHCVKDGYRYWDPNVNVTKETPTWQAIWKAAQPMLTGSPQVIIFKGQKGESYPIISEAETLALLKKIGGA